MNDSEKQQTRTSFQPYILPAWGLFVIALGGVFFIAQSLLIPIFLAVFIALTLYPLVTFLFRNRIPRPIGSALIMIISTTLIVAALNYLAEPAGVWIERVPVEVRLLERKVRAVKKSIKSVQKTTEKINQITEIQPENKNKVKVVEKQDLFSSLLDNTQAFVLGILIFYVFLFFLMAYGEKLLRQISKYQQQPGNKSRIMRVSYEAQQQASRYLLYITLINITLGIVTGTALWLLGMPNPMVWGASTTILNFIPYIGPAINLSIVALVSLMTFDAAYAIALPPLTVLLLNILEGQLIQPLIVGKMLIINPIIVFLFILFWGALWGVAGVFLAVPILVVIKTILDQNFDQHAS